jgi:hypothetical protein
MFKLKFNKGTATDFDGKFSLKGICLFDTCIHLYWFKNFEYKVTSNNNGLKFLQEMRKFGRSCYMVMVAKKKGSDRCRIY